MSTLKVLFAVAVIVVSCAIIYPRFVHPIVLQALGSSENQKRDTSDPVYPPNYRNMHPEKGLPHAAQDDAQKNVKASPHQGMKTAAENVGQHQQGAGRGMMSVVLPMYAVAIVFYLVYTLLKVFNKSQSSPLSQERTNYDSRVWGNVPLDRMGFPLDFDGMGDVQHYLHDYQHKRELEDLLARVDSKQASMDELKLLKKRLEQTEAHMSRILMAMQTDVASLNALQDPDETKPDDLNTADMEFFEGTGRQEVMDKEDVGKKKAEGEIEEKEEEKLLENKEENAYDSKKSNLAMQKLKREVDLDGIDKDSDDDHDYVNRAHVEEVGSYDEVKRNVEEVFNEGENIRRRRGRWEHEH